MRTINYNVPKRMNVSDVIKALQEILDKHGDCEVIAGGGDYPDYVKRINIQKDNKNAYVPEGCVHII